MELDRQKPRQYWSQDIAFSQAGEQLETAVLICDAFLDIIHQIAAGLGELIVGYKANCAIQGWRKIFGGLAHNALAIGQEIGHAHLLE